MGETNKAWVLYDGECGVCRRAVAWARAHDTSQALTFVPFQEAPSPPMTPELRSACARAVHVLTPDGRTLRAGRASMYVLARTGHPRLARMLIAPPFLWGTELGYWLVARNRPLLGRYLFRGQHPA